MKRKEIYTKTRRQFVSDKQNIFTRRMWQSMSVNFVSANPCALTLFHKKHILTLFHEKHMLYAYIIGSSEEQHLSRLVDKSNVSWRKNIAEQQPIKMRDIFTVQECFID